MEIKLKAMKHFLIFFWLLLSIQINADLVEKIIFDKVKKENVLKPETQIYQLFGQQKNY